MDILKKKNGNKYLTLVSTEKNKEVFIRYTELWYKIKNLIECNSIKRSSTERINRGEYNSTKAGEYEKDFLKIKFNSDDNLSLNKILELHNMTIVIRSIFQEDGEYYPQIFIDECFCELQILEYYRIDLSEGIDVNKTNASKEGDVCNYWYFEDIGFKYEPYLCNGCHDLMQKAINFNDVATVSIKGSD